MGWNPIKELEKGVSKLGSHLESAVNTTIGIIGGFVGFMYSLYELATNGIPKEVFEDRSQMSTGASTPRQFAYGNSRIGGRMD